jgi:uncharacterized protein
MMRRLLSIVFVTMPVALIAQTSVRDLYTKMEVNIPMRDGKKLFTSIYVPKNSSKKAPFLMMRTPYSVRPYGPDAYKTSLGPENSFTGDGYIFVYQDVRGRYMSEGEFNWMNPYLPRKREGEVDETTDTHDTIEWLLKNIPSNNGRVGVYGTSFPGHYAAQCLIDPHPALKAASPQAPMNDNWLGDDMHHNGAFFLPHSLNFMNGFDQPRPTPVTQYGERAFSHGTNDGYKFFLELGPISNSLTKLGMDRARIWKLWMEHEDYDEYWQAQNVAQHMRRADKVPTLWVGGWFDAEDLAGPLNLHAAVEKNTPVNKSKIVMGPWYHGSWNGGPGDTLWDQKWPIKTGEDFRVKMQKPFFKAHLWDGTEDDLPEAAAFDTGAGVWRAYTAWPPKATESSFYPHPGGKMDTKLDPAVGGKFSEWLSDTAKPVPASNTISIGMPREYMLEDQRFAFKRPDVMSYETEPLTEDMTVVGPIKVNLFFSSTGTDSDFVVKLIDVFPNDYATRSARESAGVQMGGYQMMVRGEPFRAKYRKSWSRPEPLAPGKVEEINMEMPAVCHTFRKGHKIMVQVQSSWFPIVGLNPQVFTKIFFAKPEDFKPATQRLYLSGINSTRIILPTVK